MSGEPESFLDKIFRIFRQKAVASMNRLDDPAEAIDAVIADQLQSINNARADLAAVATAAKRLDMMTTEFNQRAERHMQEAKTARASGNGAGARTSVRRGLECERLTAESRAQYELVETKKKELERLLDDMRANYDRLRMRREAVAGQAAAARAAIRGNENLSALGEGAQREQDLERARLALSDLVARADATTDLRTSGALDAVGPGEFDTRSLVSDADVDERLRALEP